MDRFSRVELRQLLEASGKVCVSVFMPTDSPTQQHPIRLKNLLRRAEELLERDGLKTADARELLDPAYRLVAESLFWRHQSDGLALFLSSEGFHRFRLPIRFDELVSVSERYHIKPLVPLLHNDGRFYVLTINQKNIRVFLGSRSGLQELEVEGVPKSIEAAQLDVNPEDASQLNFRHVRARSSWAGTTAGQRSGLFPGHGDEAPDKAQVVLPLFRLVDKGLHERLRDEHAPLVLAGVEYLHPIYREANTYPHLMDEGIPISVQDESLSQLHEQAWALVEPQFRQSQRTAVDRYLELASTPKASHSIKDIVPAAHHGRVDTLFVALDHQRWGTFDAGSGVVDVHLEQRPGDVDLLDLAAGQAIANGGAVYALHFEQMPDQVLCAATYRY